jgi:two-component system KDP operon response regulator KdpE
VTADLALDVAGQRLLRGSAEIHLSQLEFQLLSYLVQHAGMVLSRGQLLGAVWGSGYERPREVDVYVRYLRQKLEPVPARPRYLVTRWGQGYEYRLPGVGRRVVGGFQQHPHQWSA